MLVLVVILILQGVVASTGSEGYCHTEAECSGIMHCIGFNSTDGSIFMETRPIPSLKEGDVLIKVAAAGVNRLDLLQVAGRYPPPPGESDILGVEVSGTIESLSSLAEAQSKFKKGDRVMALIGGGGYAEYATAPYQCVMPVPESVELQNAAAIPEAYITAYQALIWNGNLQDGHTILLHAGASSVGIAAIQIAKSLRNNVKVISTSRTSKKLPTCTRNGADFVINSKEQDFPEEVMKITNGRGADIIVDVAAGSTWEKNMKCLATDGHLLLIALLGGAMTEGPVNLGTILSKRLTVRGSTLRSRSLEYKGKLIEEITDNLLPLFNSKKCWPEIDSVHSIAKTAEVHEMMRQNNNTGKLILTL